MFTAMLITLFGGAVYYVGVLASRQRLRGWQDAVESCGLQVVEASAGWSPRLRARSGLVYVGIGSFGDKGRSTRIVVEAPAPPDFRSVTIRPESTLQFGREIEIGDRPFDDMFFIQGPARLVFALLDAKTRRLLVDLKEKSGLSITSGVLWAVFFGDGKVADVLPLLLEVGKRFAPPMNVLQRLVENATEDPDPGVRLQNLLLLIRELAWSPTGRSARPARIRSPRSACGQPGSWAPKPTASSWSLPRTWRRMP
jgi:hypothetical protein